MIGNKLEQILTQKLTISNKIVQSLKILNMGRIELEEALEKEAESNPLLEVEIDKNEIDWEKYLDDYKKNIIYDKNNVEYNDGDIDFENITRSTDSLYDNLYAQINIMKIPKNEKNICKYLIDSLDNDGYLREDEVVIMENLKIEPCTYNKCLSYVQQLEPSGIGARNIEECLLLQLRKEDYDEITESIIKNDLNLVANSNISKLCQKYKVSKQRMIDIIDIIKKLDPRPVSMHSEDKIVYIYPDVYVEKINGRSEAKAYNEEKTKIYINSYYRDLLKNTDDDNAKKFIKNKLESARKMMRDVSERNTTVLNLANAIIDEQRDFFDYGGDLKPLLMTDLAEKMECSISTISRGVSDKYMLTQNGIVELKKFFTNSHKNISGESVSTTMIKDMIKDIIDGEDKKKPLSDSKIEDILKNRGIEIARRTVSKYREELGYLGSSKRKKYK